MIVEREPFFAELLELPAKAGENAVEDNLVPWVEELLQLLRDNQPIFYALMGDRNVFARFKERLRERETGPLAVFKRPPRTCAPSRSSGALDPGVPPDVVASILIGACRDQTLTRALAGVEPTASEVFARALVRTVVFGLAPDPARCALKPTNAEEEAS